MTTVGYPPAPSGTTGRARGAEETVEPAATRGRSFAGAARAVLLAGAGYLVLAVALWSQVWTGHPTSTTTCGCGDSSLFTWFLAWPAYALSHGLDPFYSTAMGLPHGVNLLANTSEPALGILLAPVTWAFGPIATLNVALTLAPALSALAMFMLLQRFVRWAPAAFVGGLLYGFSPFVLVSLDDAHLMLGMAVVPPLVVACLDELLFRQRARPVVTGLLLGALVAFQFFLGTEVLSMLAILGGLSIAVVVAFVRVARPDAFRSRRRHASVALATAAVTAGLLLAWPTWFALAGPGHLSGLVWPHLRVASAGTGVGDYVLPAPPLSTGFFGAVMSRVVGGAQGPVLSSQYFGFGTVAVVVAGLAVWRRDLRLWAFAAVALISTVLSLGLRDGSWSPWAAFSHLPLADNISPSRFALLTYLAVAALLGMVVDHVHTAVRSRWGGARSAATLAGLSVATVALVPVAVYLAPSVPITTQAVRVPAWFRSVGRSLPGGQVVLVLPAPFGVTQSAMTWQAVDGMHFSLAGQGGPGGVLQRAGVARAGQQAIVDDSFYFSSGPSLSAATVAAVRTALSDWGVTTVVIPDEPRLPAYERIRSVTEAAVLMTAATGERPVFEAQAWVWQHVPDAARRRVQVGDGLLQCAQDVHYRGAFAVETATACALTTIGGR